MNTGTDSVVIGEHVCATRDADVDIRRNFLCVHPPDLRNNGYEDGYTSTR